jgi:hypothetical protein
VPPRAVAAFFDHFSELVASAHGLASILNSEDVPECTAKRSDAVVNASCKSVQPALMARRMNDVPKSDAESAMVRQRLEASLRFLVEQTVFPLLTDVGALRAYAVPAFKARVVRFASQAARLCAMSPEALGVPKAVCTGTSRRSTNTTRDDSVTPLAIPAPPSTLSLTSSGLCKSSGTRDVLFHEATSWLKHFAKAPTPTTMVCNLLETMRSIDSEFQRYRSGTPPSAEELLPIVVLCAIRCGSDHLSHSRSGSENRVSPLSSNDAAEALLRALQTVLLFQHVLDRSKFVSPLSGAGHYAIVTLQAAVEWVCNAESGVPSNNTLDPCALLRDPVSKGLSDVRGRKTCGENGVPGANFGNPKLRGEYTPASAMWQGSWIPQFPRESEDAAVRDIIAAVYQNESDDKSLSDRTSDSETSSAVAMDQEEQR